MAGYPVPMLSTADAATFAATRRSVHSVAEHVLAPDLHRATGRIALRVTPGGFGQPERVVDGVRRRARLDGASLVVDHDAEGEVWHPLTTLGAAAQVLGLPPAAGTGTYATSSVASPDLELSVDAGAMHTIAEWFRFAEEALETVRRRHAHLQPAVVQLWPEHFDLATSMAEVNLGASPGDDDRPEPYLYVGPWSPPPVGGFWNEPYGAALAQSQVASLDAAVAFFQEGLALATGKDPA